MIKATYRFNEDSYLQIVQRINQARKAVWLRRRYKILSFVVFVPFAVLMMLDGYWGSSLTLTGMTLAVLLCSPLLKWQYYRNLRRQVPHMPSYQQIQSIAMDEASMQFIQPLNQSSYQWEAVTWARIFDDGILLLAGGVMYYWVAYHNLEDIQQKEELITLVQKKVFDCRLFDPTRYE
jgi:uncharacterized membrane protein